MNSVQEVSQERTLDELLNIGHTPFETYNGSIPESVGGLREAGREFAGGKIVLKERLEALQLGNAERIKGWGHNYFDLADASVTFEDLLKLQPDSGLLKGVRGVVETQDGFYVAIDAKSLESALSNGGMQYFKVSGQETVTYRLKNGQLVKETALDVVLLPYDKSSVKFTPDQFRAINAPELKRKEIIYDRDLHEEEIVKDGKVVHPAWAIYPANVVAPLVAKTFEFNGKEWNYDTNMGLFLSGEPQNNAEMRALFVGRLRGRSLLNGRNGLGNVNSRVVGVDGKYVAGAPQNLAPHEQDLLTAYRRDNIVFNTPKGTFAKTAAPVQPKQ